MRDSIEEWAQAEYRASVDRLNRTTDGEMRDAAMLAWLRRERARFRSRAQIQTSRLTAARKSVHS